MNETKLNEPNVVNFKVQIVNLLKFAATPLMFVTAGVVLLALLGIAQRAGWITSGSSGGGGVTAQSGGVQVDYICPMMCTPPQQEPGRCPVCAMELVPASGGSSGGDERSVVVDPATRRVINIQTASVKRISVRRKIRAVGEIGYDEGKMKTISAYAAGRFDKMYVDFEGAIVKQGDRLAEFYSPDLYSSQVEFLQATEGAARRGTIPAVQEANRRLQANAKQRLVELGMSDQQIQQLASSRKAVSRLEVLAPIHGTVIERLAVEGEYIQAGQPIFRLADLSSVWLLLELFPEEAAAVREGQIVTAQLQSMPNRTFTGPIEFIDPKIKRASRTVSVRVVMDNSAGLIRIGDYAKAEIELPVSDEPSLVVPQGAVLTAASQSIVYVEEETGRFEIRRVIAGPSVEQGVVITRGLAEGEKVATSGGFLLDSQMQLVGNPSLIDPSRATAPLEMIAGFNAAELAEIQQLPDSEQQLAIEQNICPVTEAKLGSMGVPKKVQVEGVWIYICCDGCREDVVADPERHLSIIERCRKFGAEEAADDAAFEVPEISVITPIESQSEYDSFEIEVPPIEDIEISVGEVQ